MPTSRRCGAAACSRRIRRCRPATTGFRSTWCARVLGDEQIALLEAAHCVDDGALNMTHVALRLARFVNGVAMKHREVSQGMFPNFPIDAITNGVHAGTWTSPAFQRLFDRRIPEWRTDNLYLRYAVGIPLHGDSRRARRSEEGDDRGDRRAHRRRARSEGVHDRVRPACHAVQARRSDVHRSRSASRRSRPASVRCRSSSAARRIRTTAAARTSFVEFTRRRRRCAEHDHGRLRRELRDGDRRHDRRRRRSLAEQSDEAARGERHERDEGRAQRRAEPERARRLVDRRPRRGRDRLVDRRARSGRRSIKGRE